jgi:hypothetical protein
MSKSTIVASALAAALAAGAADAAVPPRDAADAASTAVAAPPMSEQARAHLNSLVEQVRTEKTQEAAAKRPKKFLKLEIGEPTFFKSSPPNPSASTKPSIPTKSTTPAKSK